MKYKLITETQHSLPTEIEKHISDGWEICGNIIVTGQNNSNGWAVYAILVVKQTEIKINLVNPSMYAIKSCFIPDCNAPTVIQTIGNMYRVHCSNCAYISGSYFAGILAVDSHNKLYNELQKSKPSKKPPPQKPGPSGRIVTEGAETPDTENNQQTDIKALREPLGDRFFPNDEEI